MIDDDALSELILPLHSNLVLFKCNKRASYADDTYNFTFQSGSIQMSTTILESFHVNFLYIPIWFYSNAPCGLLFMSALYLYIPIWFYSNWEGAGYILKCSYFTFQSGSIQMHFLICRRLYRHALHSNLVLFKFGDDEESGK